MLEVCFNDSVKGALAFAQHCGDDVIGETVCFVTDKKGLAAFFAKRKARKEYREKQIALQKQAVALGGNREDIAGLSFCLSEGDIKSPIRLEDCPRKEYICAIFSFDRHNEQTDMEASIQEFWTGCIKDLQKLKANPPQIRIWLDRTPDAQCGLRFLADLLKGSKTEIHVVELPSKIIEKDHCAVEYRGWGEVEPQLYGTFLDRENVLTEKEVYGFAAEWELLKAENAPLRVVENGLVVSADLSYYDDSIRKEFPKEAGTIAYVIGSALGKQKIPTGDVFIANRIKVFIKSGELKIVRSGNGGFYATVVQCGK